MRRDDAELTDLGVAVGAKSFDFGATSLLCSNFDFHGAEASDEQAQALKSKSNPLNLLHIGRPECG